MFDPKATGPGSLNNPQLVDGAVPSEGGTGGGTSPAGAGGRGGQAGDGIGTGAVSGGGAGGAGASASGSGGAGIGGMSGGMAGGPPPPPPLLNGEACTEDGRCMSGHCDGICCDKGAECCKTVDDCTTQPGGLGMSCDDRSECRGSAGKITCTSEFKCITINGQRDDRACTNRVEANDCGLYNSVFCLGGELQNGAPQCATTCASDSDCDAEAHCNEGQCVADLPNGEACTRNEDCTAAFCRNGICCGRLGDCCKTADDCPDMYSRDPVCNNLSECRGTRTDAVCNFNICSSAQMPANEACNGMIGDDCGFYQNVVCMAGRNNSCRTNCTNMGDCDTDRAFCDSGRCVAKRELGMMCTMNNQCASNVCNNNVCCQPGAECCTNAEQCTMGLDARCDRGRPMECQGSIKPPSCQSNRCSYSPERAEDDRGCRTGRNDCGGFKDIMCNGERQQRPCDVLCTTLGSSEQCDTGNVCAASGGQNICTTPGSGTAGGPAPENPGNGNGNGNEDDDDAP